MNLLTQALARYRPIPRVIHQIWNDDQPPKAFEEFTYSWIREHRAATFSKDDCSIDPFDDGPIVWKHCFWTFDKGADFLARHYPRLFVVFHALPKVIQKADLLRYAVLHHYGGIYADLDTECLRPFEPLLWGADFVAGYEAKSHASLCNAILCSVPHHPILRAMIRYLEAMPDDRTELGADVGHVFATTGSLALTPMILANRTARTRLVPASVFYPFSWAEKERCGEAFPGSYAKHYWVSGWYEEGKYRVDEYWTPKPTGKQSALFIYSSTDEYRKEFFESHEGQELIRKINNLGAARRAVRVDYTPPRMTAQEIDRFNERLLGPYVGN